MNQIGDTLRYIQIGFTLMLSKKVTFINDNGETFSHNNYVKFVPFGFCEPVEILRLHDLPKVINTSIIKIYLNL